MVEAAKMSEVESLLYACWPYLEGAFEGGMADSKLLGRTEGLSWDSPKLNFTIERHGAAVMGSAYAEKQVWMVDVSKGTAWIQSVGKRRIGPISKRLKVEPLVEEVIVLVRAQADDARLQWKDPNKVRIMIGEIIPQGSAVKQTLAGRRRRFAIALKAQMGAIGWESVPNAASHTYSRGK